MSSLGLAKYRLQVKTGDSVLKGQTPRHLLVLAGVRELEEKTQDIGKGHTIIYEYFCNKVDEVKDMRLFVEFRTVRCLFV